MELRQMEYLVALADERHFTRAAAVCNVSQSGLSAAIRALETELGTTLFERTTRRVAPTEAGQALLPHARTMLAHAAAARDAMALANDSLSGPLRVGAEQCLGVVDVTRLVSRTTSRAPGLDLTFEQAGTHALVEHVRQGELDIAFVANFNHLGALKRHELGSEPLIALMPADHPLATLEHVAWSDLDGAEMVDFHPSWAIRSLNDTACESRGFSRHVRCTVNDVHTLLDLVQQGLGVAVVPAHIAAKPQAAGLTALPVAMDTPAWTVSAVTSSRPSSAVSVMLSVLRDETSIERAHRGQRRVA